MNITRGHWRSGIAAFGCGAALIVMPAAVASAASSDTSPSCPTAYECLQPGTDPGVPYGTDPSVPYGPDVLNSRLPTGSGSGSDTGGGV
jgi:hypothetical protein